MPHPSPTTTQAELSGQEALKEACDRNIPVEVFRAADRGRAPARGRLLSFEDDQLIIEKLQMIGSKFELPRGTMIEGYFRHGSQLFRLDSEVKESMVAARLNGRLIVPALKLCRPRRIAPGQRRSVFRVNTSARPDAPRALIWLAPTFAAPDPEAPPPEPAPFGELPSNPPDFRARVINASDAGLGLLIDSCLYSRLRHMQPIVVAVKFADDPAPLVLSATVRHAAPVREVDARVGVHLTDDGSREYARKIRRLSRYIAEVQREQLR